MRIESESFSDFLFHHFGGKVFNANAIKSTKAKKTLNLYLLVSLCFLGEIVIFYQICIIIFFNIYLALLSDCFFASDTVSSKKAPRHTHILLLSYIPTEGNIKKTQRDPKMGF